MPKMDEYKVCEALKADDKTRYIYGICLSVLDEVFDNIKAFQYRENRKSTDHSKDKNSCWKRKLNNGKKQKQSFLNLGIS